MPLDTKNRFPLLYLILILSIILLLHTFFFRQDIEELTYGEFKNLIRQEYRIEECIVTTTQIQGVYIKDDAVWEEVKKQKRRERLEKEKEEWLKKARQFVSKPKDTKDAKDAKDTKDAKNTKDSKDTKSDKKTDVEKAKENETPLNQFLNLFKVKKDKVPFITVRVHDDEDLVKLLEDNHVPFRGRVDSGWGTFFLSWFLPLILIVVLWIFLMRRMNSYGKDVMSFVKTRAKITPENTKTTFADVAGCDEAKEELQEIVEFLKCPGKFEQLGGKIPKGALLVGPPGTGKTLLARAVAGEASVPFFSISGSEFVEMFVGVGASRVRDLFQQAKAKPPCILFIDEIDAVGRHRGAGLGGGHDEREQTLNQLLAEMDGFETNKGIIVLAATNRPDILDPALLRPGRFDRRIVIDQPDIKGREDILKIHAKGKPLSNEVDIKKLAQRTPGFSGADLANIMNEAALLAARKSKKEIDQSDIAEAVERVIAGPERKSRIISAKEKRITAYHEVGHAMIAELHPHGDPVHKVSIIPRGSALGYTLSLPEEDKYTRTREELLAKICIMLAGRVAEEIGLGIISTGAQNDLEHVTDIARSFVARYGMSKKMGPMAFEKEEGYVFLGKNFDRKSYFSGTTMDQIDEEVRKVVWDCYETTTTILNSHKGVLDKIAEVVLEKETMEGTEFRAILKKFKDEAANSNNQASTATAVPKQENQENTLIAIPLPEKPNDQDNQDDLPSGS